MADSGWGAGAVGAFGAMIGSVVGAGVAGAALQSKKFRHVSSDHRQRALLLTTAGTGVLGALASVKLALDNGVGCPPCPAGTTRQLPASTTTPSPTPGTPPAAGSTANSWEGGATAAFGAIVGGVLGGAATAAALSSKQFRRTSSGNRQRSLVLASAGGTVLGALFGGKAAADMGMGCGTCAPSGAPTNTVPVQLPSPNVLPQVLPTPQVIPQPPSPQAPTT